MNRSNEENHARQIPDVSQLEAMLSSFSPQPSSRFYNTLITAVWSKATDVRGTIRNRTLSRRKLVFGIAGGLILITILAISLIPSIRAVARKLINSFISTPTNQIELQVTLSNPVDLFHYSDPVNYSLSIPEAERRAGFPVKVISELPEDLTLVGSMYESSYGAVIILYQKDDYKLFLTERPVGNGRDVFSIGASAQIDLVMIGDILGEYVVGGWKSISTTQTTVPGNQTNITAVWETTLPQFTLRWQENGFNYELRMVGEAGLSKTELITLANELK